MWKGIQWVLDWIGRAQTTLWAIGLGGVVVSGFGAILEASPLNIFWLFIAGSLVGLGCLIAWQNYQTRTQPSPEAVVEVRASTPTLRIKYTDNAVNRGFMRFEGNGNVCTWYLEIVNESPDTDARDVEIKVEAYDQIPDLLSPHAQTGAFTQVGIVLAFERGGNTRTIHRQDSEWVRFLSFDRLVPRRWIQIGEYVQDPLDLHGKIMQVHTPHRIELTVRTANGSPMTASFFVKAENEMLDVRKL